MKKKQNFARELEDLSSGWSRETGALQTFTKQGVAKAYVAKFAL